MNGITLLIIVLIGGYMYNKNYQVDKKTKMYLAVFLFFRSILR